MNRTLAIALMLVLSTALLMGSGCPGPDINHKVDPIPTLTVLSPNGGESWTVGSSATVTWSSQGNVGKVNIDLSNDGGSTWSSWMVNLDNNGSRTVTVKEKWQSTTCRIRVRDGATGISDISDANFTISTVVVLPDSSIVAWGNNDDGQCNVPSPNTGFVAVAAGLYHSLGAKTDSLAGGPVVAWGNNSSGQCDAPSPNTGYVAITAGFNHSLGLKNGGSIVAWGDNGVGICNVPPPNTDFVAIAAGAFHSLGLKSSGLIVAAGSNGPADSYDVPLPNTDFVAVAAGGLHSLGIKSDGSVVAWGDNSYGQCNVPSPNPGFIAIAGGGGHSLGLKSDGSVVAWGDNSYGQCNVPSPNTGFVAIAAGSRHGLGLKSDGSVVAWGDNSDGQCNVPSPNTGFVAVAAGMSHSLGIRDLTRVAKPLFYPGISTFSKQVKVIVFCSTPGATIRYTTDGIVPSQSNGTVISSGSSVNITSTTTLKAIAYKNGMTDSLIKEAMYKKMDQVAQPTFSPDGGSFAGSVNVTISCATPDAMIKYTTNGSDPSQTNGISITSGNSITISSTTNLKAIAYKSNMTDSPIKEATYTKEASQITDAIGSLLDAAGGTGDVIAAANALDQAIADAYRNDPEHAYEYIQESLALELASPGAMDRLADADRALAGRYSWTPAAGQNSSQRATSQVLNAVAPSNGKMVAILVNGVGNTYADADNAKEGLNTLLTSGPNRIPVLTGVGLHYNVSSTDQERSVWGGITCHVTSLLSLGWIPEKPCVAAGVVGDIWEASSEKLLYEWIGKSDVGIDPVSIAQRVGDNLKGGMSVLLIGHSQGNLKIEAALELLWNNYGGWADSLDLAHRILQSRLAVVGIACPASYTTAIQDRGLHVIKLNIRKSSNIDLYLELLRAYIWKRLPELNWKEDLVSLIDLNELNGIRLPNQPEEVFPKVHYLYETYLRLHGSEIREHIRTLVSTVMALALPDVKATAERYTAQPGESIQMNGTTSGGASPFFYKWTMVYVPGGADLTLHYTFGDAPCTAIFGPNTTSGDYRFKLTVTDATGQTDSDEFTITASPWPAVAQPTFNPDGGSFTSSVSVTISCATPDAIIKYTTNGSDPSQTNGISITSGDSVTINTTTNLKAIAYKSDMTDSQVKSATYTKNEPTTITVSSPNGGESWTVGSSATVTWNSTGSVGNVNIDLSTDGGSTWTTSLASSTANDGTEPITVPNSPSTSCRIRVQETDGSPTDMSNANFTIRNGIPPGTYSGDASVLVKIWMYGQLVTDQSVPKTLTDTFGPSGLPQSDSGQDIYVGYIATYKDANGDYTLTVTGLNSTANAVTVNYSCTIIIQSYTGPVTLTGPARDEYVWTGDGVNYTATMDAEGPYLDTTIKIHEEAACILK